MRKVLILAAAAASALAIAAPASAQYYPAPPPPGYGYGNPGYGNGHNVRTYGHVRGLQIRIDQLQRHIRRLDARNIISEREADRLRAQSRDIERSLRRASYNGLNPREFAVIDSRIRRLEYRIGRDAHDGNRWGRNDWRDRDRDGRNDRWEDDRGRDHDGRWDRDDD